MSCKQICMAILIIYVRPSDGQLGFLILSWSENVCRCWFCISSGSSLLARPPKCFHKNYGIFCGTKTNQIDFYFCTPPSFLTIILMSIFCHFWRGPLTPIFWVKRITKAGWFVGGIFAHPPHIAYLHRCPFPVSLSMFLSSRFSKLRRGPGQSSWLKEREGGGGADCTIRLPWVWED